MLAKSDLCSNITINAKVCYGSGLTHIEMQPKEQIIIGIHGDAITQLHASHLLLEPLPENNKFNGENYSNFASMNLGELTYAQKANLETFFKNTGYRASLGLESDYTARKWMIFANSSTEQLIYIALIPVENITVTHRAEESKTTLAPRNINSIQIQVFPEKKTADHFESTDIQKKKLRQKIKIQPVQNIMKTH